MRADEFITEHRMVWKRTGSGVKLRWRCEGGPRNNRTVPAVKDCSAAPDMAAAQRMKKTRQRTKIRQARRTKRTKRVNPVSSLVQRLNKAVNKIIKKTR
jgi:hypothetical protein